MAQEINYGTTPTRPGWQPSMAELLMPNSPYAGWDKYISGNG
jgi:hypothetical protein